MSRLSRVAKCLEGVGVEMGRSPSLPRSLLTAGDNFLILWRENHLLVVV